MIYRKRGQVVRWENGVTVRVAESGVAIESDELFECYPELSSTTAEGSLQDVADAIQNIAPNLERLILTHGHATHEYDGRTWSDESRRVHLSILTSGMRALLDLASFDLDDITRVAHALQRAEPREREAPRRLRLAANVTAALLPSLPDIVQTAGGVDGYGNPIVEARGPWPNVYRPSYRVRPVRMPLNIRSTRDAHDLDASLPIAVALLAPADGTALRVLIDDGARVYPSTIRVAHLEAIAREVTWYPYAAGAFGAEAMVCQNLSGRLP